MYARYIKRGLDLGGAMIGLLLLLPLLVVIGLLLAVMYRGNPFFVQRRAGYRGQIFSLWKFRTMHHSRGADGALLPDAVRLHPLGRLLRRLSLDELPQLVNVLLGDMSLVGPRPLLPAYLPYYSEAHKRRHEVRPGITGWAQVNGRNALKFSQRFAYDVWYVDHVSFMVDCRILWMTIRNAFSRGDATRLEYLEDIDDLGIGRDLPAHYRKEAMQKHTAL